MEPGPSGTKKRKIEQKFKDEYCSFDGVQKSKLDDKHAFCIYCRCDFAISHGGRDDCRKHVGTKKHLQYKSLQSSAMVCILYLY